jgi:hypothetical protein
VIEITGGISSRPTVRREQTHRAAYRTFELIAPIKNLSTSRLGLRNCGLSTDVDKAASNSNLNHHFRIRVGRGRARRMEGKG